MYKEFWRLFATEYHGAKRAVVICIMTIVVSMLEGINVGLLLPLLETLQPSDTERHWLSNFLEGLYSRLGVTLSLGTILLSLGAVVLIIAVFKYGRMVLIANTSTNFVAWLRQRTMKNLLNANMSYHHDQKIGDLASVLTTQANVASSTVVNSTELLANIGIIITYMTAALLISPLLTIVAFVVLLTSYLSMQFLITKAKFHGKSLADTQNNLETQALENLNGIKLIKSFSLESLSANLFKNKASEVAQAHYNLQKNRGLLLVLQEAVLFGLIAAMVYAGISVFGLEFSVIIAVLFILYRVAPRVTGLNNSRQAIAANVAGIHNVSQVIELSYNAVETSGNIHITGISRSIELIDLSFGYNNNNRIIQNASLSIEKGQVTAIVGETGCGKSTILDLVFKHYLPDAGSIVVDDNDLSKINLDSWRSIVGFVSQDIFLFNDTIRNNLSIADENYSYESIQQAVKLAQAEDFIIGLPNGYDTIVGDRGWNLSGGQRQKISLARAILKNPKILILDEPTSALDTDSEAVVQEYIENIKGSATVIVVSHRMSTIKNADKIAVLRGGKFVEIGNWETLMKQKGIFYQQIHSSP